MSGLSNLVEMKIFLKNTHLLFLFMLTAYVLYGCLIEIQAVGFELSNLLSLAGSMILYTGIHVYLLSWIISGIYIPVQYKLLKSGMHRTAVITITSLAVVLIISLITLIVFQSTIAVVGSSIDLSALIKLVIILLMGCAFLAVITTGGE